MKKIITVTILGLSIFALGAKESLAWTFPVPQIDLSGLNEAMQKAAKQNKCKAIKAKMSGTANTIKSSCTSNLTKFNAISGKLDSVIDKTEDKGYNVGKLKMDTNAFKDKVDDFKKNCDQAYASLAFTALANCETDKPDEMIDTLKTMSSNFHSSVTKTKTSFSAARDQYRNGAKVDLYTMSQQKYKE